MVIGAAVCLGLAVLIGGSGLWTLARRPPVDLTSQVLRMVAPTQLAAAVMLAAGGVIALAAPGAGPVPLILAGFGAVATIAVGSWQAARYAARREGAGASACGPGGGCAGCTRDCGEAG